MTSPSLLVMSIFAPSPWNELWLNLQRRFIKRYTSQSFDYEVYLNGVEARDYEACSIAHVSATNEGHIEALANVIALCRQREHRWFLILDSDCFPVTANWDGILCEQMAHWGREMAAPVRMENLDVFPHPCAVLLSREGLLNPALTFDPGAGSPNLLGETILDPGVAMVDARPSFFPLLRTNRVNLHPVAGAIYHHLFYHHGAGSRSFSFRVTEVYKYYEHWLSDGRPSQTDLMTALAADPEGFIAMLKDGPGYGA